MASVAVGGPSHRLSCTDMGKMHSRPYGGPTPPRHSRHFSAVERSISGTQPCRVILPEGRAPNVVTVSRSNSCEQVLRNSGSQVDSHDSNHACVHKVCACVTTSWM